jgi:hypothetical protein
MEVVHTFTLTKNAGPQFNFLPNAEPMDYFSSIFNDELSNNSVIETNTYAKDKIAELHLSPRFIWNRLYNISAAK